ncbi:MAG TPA: BatD family protein [Pirellulales bacterium]|nr:BatD family protein [Pirellulales bacterium]HVC97337.1 BatD family protein [Pirellulales bacterium]
MRRTDLGKKRNTIRQTVLSAGLALGLLTSQAPAAEVPEIAVEASAGEIYIGESVEYNVEIKNSQNPARPDMSALTDDFDVVAEGDESRNQSSTFIYNGRVTRQDSFSHVYRFRLTPKRSGELTIPAPSVTIGGQTISGRPRALRVIAPEEQELVVPEISLDRSRVYPTQPFEVTLRVLVQPLPDEPDLDPLAPLRRQPPHLEANWVDPPAGLEGGEKIGWLEGLLANDGTGFTLNNVTQRSGSFFDGPRLAVFNLYQGREGRAGLDGKEIEYFVYELRRALTPNKAGRYQLGPAVVKGTFVDGNAGSRYSARRLVAVAPAVTVEVREVPTPRPPTFCGGIGNYHVSASAHPTTLRVGDPLTLSLDIQRGDGSGSLDIISAPDLTANRQLAANFDILDKDPTGRTKGDMKRFAYAMRPSRAGVEIPPLTVTVFDPETESFSEITTQPISLEVSEAGHVDAGDLVGNLTDSGKQEIKSREEGIFQNVTDPSELADQRVDIPALAGVAAGTWCVVGCLIVAVNMHRRKSADAGWRRKQQARPAAVQKMAEARRALADGRPELALRATRTAVVGLIADSRNIVAEGLTASEADAALAETAVTFDERAEVLRLLESIEAAEYGLGSAAGVSAMIERAEQLIPRLARQLDRER